MEPKWEELGELEFEPSSCPVCGGEHYRERFQKRLLGRSMRYVNCLSCDTLFANPRATEDTLRRIYASQSFFEGKEDNINYYSFLAGEKYLSRTAQSRLSRIRKFAKGNNLLEVASAAGFFLNQAKRQGFRVQGVEFSRPMARYASERWDVPVLAESIEQVDLPQGEFDVIAGWGVFTILRDPLAALKKFRGALKPGGVLALNTYYHDGIWCRLWGANWYILVLNTSQIFSRATLRRVLRDSGFDIVSIRRDRPYASVKYAAFQLLSHVPGSVKNRYFERFHFLNSLVFPVFAPDNYEYICVKR